MEKRTVEMLERMHADEVKFFLADEGFIHDTRDVKYVTRIAINLFHVEMNDHTQFLVEYELADEDELCE